MRSPQPSPLDRQEIEQIDQFNLTSQQEQLIEQLARRVRYAWLKRALWQRLLPKAVAAHQIFGEENSGKTYYTILIKQCYN